MRLTEQEYTDLIARQQAASVRHRQPKAPEPIQAPAQKKTAAKTGPDFTSTKYNNRKTMVDGYTFDSTKEANRYIQLKQLQDNGKIHSLELQPVFVLADAVMINGRKKPKLKYLADFSYIEAGQTIIEDVKSAATRKLPAYRIKIHLMKTVHGLDVVEI